MEHSLWGNLPLLVPANSKDSVEYILQTLWRTRKIGFDSTDRDVIRDLLQLQNDSDLDPLQSNRSNSGESDVNFQLAKDKLKTMLKSMHSIRDDQLSNIEKYKL